MTIETSSGPPSGVAEKVPIGQVVSGLQLENAVKKVAAARQIDVDKVRTALMSAMSIDGNLPLSEYGMFVIYGEIRLNLPDGTRVGILPDLHVMAHNKRILWSIFECWREWRPHIVILLGDICDLFKLSRWMKPPHADSDLRAELEKTRELVWTIIELSGCLHVFIIMGNHEDRLPRWISEFAVPIASLTDRQNMGPMLTFHNLLGFTAKDPVSFIYDRGGAGGKGGGIILNGTQEFRHGHSYNRVPSSAARKETDLTNRSTITADSHSLGMSVRETHTGAVVAAKLGCLINPQHTYFDYSSDRSRTHFGLGFMEIAGGAAYLEPKPIRQYLIDGKRRHAFTFAGKLYVEQAR